MKKPLYFLAGFMSAATVVFALWYLGIVSNSLLDAVNRDNTVVKEIGNLPSPNQEFVATTTQAGNGADWCEVRISVHKKDEPFDWEREYVCITGCDTRLDLNWEGTQNLAITYSNDDESKGVRTYQGFWNKDKSVKISYKLRQ